LNKGVNSQDIIIIGDSAGGNLALYVTLQLRDLSLPLTKAVIAMSPWASFKGGYKARTENYEKDIILGKYGLKVGTVALDPTFYTKESNFTNPYVSPVFGDYSNFPDLLIQAGSYEFLLDDAKAVAMEAKAKGVNVTYSVYEEMSHVFQLFLPGIEETNKAWEEIRNFLLTEFELA
jgi:acetyl esterase/lipase